MAIREEEPAKLPKELQHFKARDIRWLWWWFINKGRPFHSEDSLKPSDVIRILTREVFESPDNQKLIQRILQEREDALVPEESFAWIGRNDQRLLTWLFTEPIVRLPSPVAPETNLFNPRSDLLPEQRRDEFIFRMDMLEESLTAKYERLKMIRSNWSALKTPDRLTKWLDRTNKPLIHWAWDYLKKHGKTDRIPIQATYEELYNGTLVALDSMHGLHPAERELFIEKMKKTWSQKKYRDSGKAKKPYHLPLTVGANNQLDWLANQCGKNRSQVLMRLIAEEFNRLEGTIAGGGLK